MWFDERTYITWHGGLSPGRPGASLSSVHQAQSVHLPLFFIILLLLNTLIKYHSERNVSKTGKHFLSSIIRNTDDYQTITRVSFAPREGKRQWLRNVSNDRFRGRDDSWELEDAGWLVVVSASLVYRRREG